MPRAVLDADFLFGIHESGGETYMLEAGKPGWILFSEAIGHDPNDRSGKDYSAFSAQGLTVIVRLNHGYYPQGTLPVSSDYGNFARRCANFVAASHGCRHWIIGNEMNYAVERPGVRDLFARGEADDPYLRALPQRHNALYPTLADVEQGETTTFVAAGDPITPGSYARCYRLCRNAIHLAPDHAEDRVLIGAVCPWNTHTVYSGNTQGDWIRYFQDILLQIGPYECDGITLHVYTHGADPALILDDSRVDAFPQYANQFQIYRDFMGAIPANMRQVPVYITETNQGQPWEDANTGWVQEAYAEIHRWNQEPDNQKIMALVLHRWPLIDRWSIDDKPGVIEDFVDALRHPYRWQAMRKGTAIQNRESKFVPRPDQSTSPRYQVQWMGGRLPEALYAKQAITFPVTVQNHGNFTWSQDQPNPVRLTYQFYQNQQPIAGPAHAQPYAALPHSVAPGESATIHAEIALPTKPGNYTLVLDLLHEGITTFQEAGADTLIRWMTVRPSPEVHSPSREAERVPAVQTMRGNGETTTAVMAPLFEQVDAFSPVVAAQGPLVAPEIVDVTAELPISDQPYLTRSLESIRYLVLNHTGAPPILPLEEIAAAHLVGGYPGIAYQFLISQGGEILQTSGLDEVVSDAEWAMSGINIALEGDFNEFVPPKEQMDAAADLCAWLISQLPDLHVEQIVGLCELIQTMSPGATFLEGPTWRRVLRDNVGARLRRQQRTATGQTGPTVTSPMTTTAPVRASLAQPTSTPRGMLVAAKPPFEDITTQLPRDPLMFYSRRAEDIHTIVINHTNVSAEISINAIAEGFRDRGLPGILYQFYIDENGAIYQTQPVLQVVDGERPYIANAINVAFAGEFDVAIPNGAQLQAGGALIAWLLTQYSHLSLEDIKGVSELIPHSSPGEQWLHGRRWKDLLLQAVQLAPERQTNLTHQEASTQNQHDMQRLAREKEVLQQQASGLRAENERLRREIEALRAEPQRKRMIPAPEVVDVVNQLPHHPTLRYDERRLSAITHIAIHHTAVPPHVGPERIAELHISEDPSRNKRPWPGIGYHYFVRADGRILRTQPLERIAYHAAGHNEYSLGIVFAGSFMNGVVPTAEQLAAGAYLTAWLLQELRIPLPNVWGHREFADSRTICPGSEWMSGRKWRDLLYDEIVRMQRGEAEAA